MEKLVKTVCMAKSGIYEYSKDDVFTKFELSKEKLAKIPSKPEYFIYRPADVLIKNKDKYIKLPLLYTNDSGHPNNFEDQNNWEKYGVGMTGDAVTVDWDEDRSTVKLCSTLTIVGEDGILAYNYGIIEVSPGYYGKFEYAPGKTVKGEDYDIIMTDVGIVDHLLMTSSGRGGEECKILDSKGGKTMPEFLKTMLIGIAKGFKMDLEFKAITNPVGDDTKAKDDDSKAKDDNYDDSKAKGDDSVVTVSKPEMKGEEPSVKDDEKEEEKSESKEEEKKETETKDDNEEEGNEENIENDLIEAWMNLHKLMGKWKDSKGKAKDTVPSAIKSTEIKANKLENNESGPDKVMHLGTGDSISPLLNSDTSIKKEGIKELFNKF